MGEVCYQIGFFVLYRKLTYNICQHSVPWLFRWHVYDIIPNRPNEEKEKKTKNVDLTFNYLFFRKRSRKKFKDSFAELCYDLKWLNCIFTLKLLTLWLIKLNMAVKGKRHTQKVISPGEARGCSTNTSVIN